MITFKEYMMTESINDRGILKALFVVGVPGSGKSYTIGKLGTHQFSPRVVNTDKATEFLSKKHGIESNADTWDSFFRDKTKPITQSMLFNYLNSMLPLFVDGTSNSTSNILGRRGLLESVGYDTGMVFVNVDLEVALARAQERGEKIGRVVSRSFIEGVFEKSQKNKEYFKSRFEFFREVDNNPGEFDDVALKKIYRSVSGFYNEPLENTSGLESLEKLRAEKQSYLCPSIFTEAELKKKAESWYRAAKEA